MGDLCLSYIFDHDVMAASRPLEHLDHRLNPTDVTVIPAQTVKSLALSVLQLLEQPVGSLLMQAIRCWDRAFRVFTNRALFVW